MATIKRKFNFELAILAMNAMYKLPIAATPSILKEVEWQREKFPEATKILSEVSCFYKRLEDFFGDKGILNDERKEYAEIIGGVDDTEMLIALADLLGDIQVYCASEMARFGIPNSEVLEIIMASNESKLDENGNPIYNEQGKFMKGPNYWKPEPKIRELILQLRGETEEAPFDHDTQNGGLSQAGM